MTLGSRCVVRLPSAMRLSWGSTCQSPTRKAPSTALLLAKREELRDARSIALFVPAQLITLEIEVDGPDRQRQRGQHTVEIGKRRLINVHEKGRHVTPLRRPQT